MTKLADYNFTISATKVLHSAVQFCLICFGIISLYYSIAGARVYLYEIIGSFTIVGLFFYFCKKKFLNRWNFSLVKISILFVLLLFLSDITSSVGVIMGGNDTVLSQYSKGIFKSLFLTVFLISFLTFNAITDFRHSVRYLNILLTMVLLSCIYQFLYLVFFLVFEVDIDDFVWPALTLGGYTPEDHNKLGNDTFDFARHGGFSRNANMLVTQILCVLPYALLMTISVSKRYIIFASIFVVSTLLTISRGGVLGLLMIMCCIPFVNKTVLVAYGRFLFTWFVVIVVLFVATDTFYDLGIVGGVYDLFVARSSGRPYFESARWSLVLAGFDMVEKSPIFGLGLNASPVLLESYSITTLTGNNLHNYWVQLFVERGIFSIFRVLFYGYILFQCYKLNNIYSQALAISIVCLLVNSLTNNGLAHPFVQLFIMSAYCCCVYQKRIAVSSSNSA